MMKTKIKRRYHAYQTWEEWHKGMWSKVDSASKINFAFHASELMKNCPKFESAMREAIIDWPISCEHNLSDTSINRLAWLGHAGCCIATGSPEDATRMGWWYLNQEEQDAANAAAQRVVDEWEKNQCQSDQLGLAF